MGCQTDDLVALLPPTMENQMENNMENYMETVVIGYFIEIIGFNVSCGLNSYERCYLGGLYKGL